jgi:uncharacterized repeat protein (TIGR01451 family)/MYXO-CTERM domain-containing protein
MRRTTALLVAAGCLVAPRFASAQALRFTTTAPGEVVAIGNTLGLSKQVNFNGPGTSDGIGTFITLDGTSFDLGAPLGMFLWPAGTTSAWQANGSTANLTVPVRGMVLYAELVWGGSFQYGTEDVTASLDTPVTLSFGADSITVTPAAATATTVSIDSGFAIRYYMRSGDVSAFVQAHGSGTYAVEGVPATQDASINQTQGAGWSIVVAMRNENAPLRNLSVFVGDTAFVDENTTVDYQVSGFCAPPSGDIEGKIAIATVEGDSNRVGDQLLIGQTVASAFVNLQGPNNDTNNFFCSQINDPTGSLDTTGSFGTANHTPGSNASGARQGWDIAHVALSSLEGQLFAGQTSAVLRTQTADDSYMPVLAAIAIDVNGPTFDAANSTTEIDQTQVSIGDTFTVTVALENEGSAPANDIVFTMPLAASLTLQSLLTDGNAGDIDGDPVTQADVTTNGVEMGDLAPGATRTVSLDLQVTSDHPFPTITIAPFWEYSYEMCVGSPIDESFSGEIASLAYEGGEGGAGGAGGAGGNMAAGGNGGMGNSAGDFGGFGGDGSGNAPNDGDDGSTDASGDCGCEMVGTPTSSGWLAGLALGLAAFTRRRRPRS